VEVSKDDSVLEVGCGTGIISIHCARSGAKVTAVDINPMAVECARENAKLNGTDIVVLSSDLFEVVEGRFDLIIFNPPYLPVSEEGYLEKAWAGGEGGIKVVDRFLDEVVDHLTPHGKVLQLLSSKMNLDELFSRHGDFSRRTIAGRRFFFEELSVMELRISKDE
jgi:release factor glutamine methyltransferase